MKTPIAIDLKVALKNFRKRKKDNKDNRRDNSLAPAGSPMVYYCRYCDCTTDVLPESHLSKPKTICDACEILVAHGYDLNAK